MLAWLLFPLRWGFRWLASPIRGLMLRRLLRDGWLELPLEGACREALDRRTRLQENLRKLLRPRDPGFVALQDLEKLAAKVCAAPGVQGLWVRLDGFEVGWTGAERIRELLARVSESGRRVVVQVEGGLDTRGALIASAADRVVMSPASGYDAAGSAAKGLFFADLLHRWGIQVEVAAAGRYKSAPDALTRTSRSPEDAEQIRAIVEALDDRLIEAIGASRGRTAEEVRSRLAKAPMTARQALSLGLIDGVERNDDAPSYARTLVGLDRPPRFGSADQFAALRVGSLRAPFKRKRLAVVKVHGTIVDRRGPSLPGADTAVRDEVVDDLRHALSDDRIGGVVLHVDSRGGSVTASDAIYGAVRRLSESKPVVAVLADAAASGGYYVACGASRILCHPWTLTGSIGVFMLFPTWPELMRRAGVGQDVIRTLEHANLLDPFNGLDESGRQHLQGQVESLYDLFLEVVSQARHRSRDEIDAVAQGRVWLGQDALKAGLVDGHGKLQDGLDWLQSQLPAPVDPEPTWIHTRRSQPRPGPASGAAAAAAAAAGVYGALGVGPGPVSEVLQLLATRTRFAAWTPSPF